MSNKKVKIESGNEIDETAEVIKEVEAIDDTPFSCVRYEDQYFLALGKYRLTELLDDKQEVIDEAQNTSWDRLLAVIHAVAQEVVLNSQKDGKQD